MSDINYEIERQAFQKFIDARASIYAGEKSDPILPNDTFQSDKSPNDLIFGAMADDFTRELINSVNKFYLNVFYCEAWFKAAADFPKGQRLSLLFQFAEPLMELALNRPYAIRSRFIFAATHLLHQSNKHRMPKWRDELPGDKDIDYKTLIRVGSGWKAFSAFISDLNGLNDQEFIKATRNFRHLSHHQMEINFDIGLVPYFRRTKTDTGIKYEYLIHGPLKFPDMLSILYRQHARARAAFMSYWSLLNDQLDEWIKAQAKRKSAASANS